MRTPTIMQLTLVLSLALGAANAAALPSSSPSSLVSVPIPSQSSSSSHSDAHEPPSSSSESGLLQDLARMQKQEVKSSPVAESPMASMRVVQSQAPSQSLQLLATVSSSTSAAEPTAASSSPESHSQTSESESTDTSASTSSHSSTSKSAGGAVPFTNIVAPPPPTAMASETVPYNGNPALGLVATASTPHDDNANSDSFSPTRAQPFKEVAHVSSAPEAPPKAPAAAGKLDEEDPPEDSSGPIGRNICLGLFTFLILAAIGTCFKDKLNGAYRRYRQHRNARETAIVNPWTQMADTDSEKGVPVHTEKDEMLTSRSAARTSAYGTVHPYSPGGPVPVSPAASSNYSPSMRSPHTVPTYNRWPNQAPPVSTESLASEMTDYSRFPMPPTDPNYRYGPYVSKPQPEHLYYH